MGVPFDEIAGEFSDLSAAQAAQFGVRLLVAGLMGGLMGWERSRVGKSAGLRTHILVAVGAAALTSVPLLAGLGGDAASRVMQGIATGIGFIGAGCILKGEGEGEVRGLTTAAGIWVAAAVGVAAGLGRGTSAVLIGLTGWFTLSVVGWWEVRLGEKPPPKPRGHGS